MNWWRRLRHRDEIERHLDAELRDHVDRQVADYVAAGMSGSEARRRARLEFGGLDQVKEICRDVRGTPWASDFRQDFRYAARLLLKDRWFTLATIVALALGIGINSTMFTIVNAMIRGLPIDNADRIMSVNARDGAGHWRGLGLSYLDFLDLRAATKTFSGLAAFIQTTTTLGDNERAPERASASYLSANAFQLLGEKPMLGRDFLPEDDHSGAQAVVIVGSPIWKGRYNADPTLIGRTININGVPTIVIGVMPDGFRFPFTSDVWQPLGLLPELSNQTNQKRDTRGLQVFGKLANRSTSAQAQSEIEAIAARLSRDYPETNRNIGAVVAGFPGHFAPDPLLIALMVAVGFVLLVACANVANLVLARSASRSHEMAIRVSLGATRWRIVRQLLVESGLLAGIAGTLGVGFSLVGVSLFSKAVAGITFPYYIQWTMDGRVLGFVAAVCLGTGLFFGLLPALHVAKTAANRSLKEGERTTTGGMGRRRWTTGLLIAELALTLVLLASAGLMMRSFLAVYRADLVVDATHAVLMPLTLPSQKYQTSEQRTAFYQRLEEQVGAIRGVSSAAFASVVPFMGGPSRQLSIDGRPSLPGEPQPTVSYVTIRGRYFETLGLRLLRGRAFTDTDGGAGHESVIVNQRFVTMFFPNDDPIGRRIRLTTPNSPAAAAPAWATVVGISPTVRQQYLQDLDPVVYLPDPAEGAAHHPHRSRAVGARRDCTSDPCSSLHARPGYRRERRHAPGGLDDPVAVGSPRVRRNVDGLCGHRAVVGGGRTVCRDSLRCGPADSRDRCPDGPRSAGGRGGLALRETNHVVPGHRPRHWARGRAGCGQVITELPDTNEPDGPDDAGGHRGTPHRRVVQRLVFFLRAARHGSTLSPR